MKNIPKQYLMIGAVVVVALILIGSLLMRKGNENSEKDTSSALEEAPEAIPTVDPSVKIEIEDNEDALIKVSGLPKGTKAVEYELSYNTESGSIEGVFGEIEVESDSDEAEEEIKFGTCSSGTCRYHEIDGRF